MAATLPRASISFRAVVIASSNKPQQLRPDLRFILDPFAFVRRSESRVRRRRQVLVFDPGHRTPHGRLGVSVRSNWTGPIVQLDSGCPTEARGSSDWTSRPTPGPRPERRGSGRSDREYDALCAPPRGGCPALWFAREARAPTPAACFAKSVAHRVGCMVVPGIQRYLIPLPADLECLAVGRPAGILGSPIPSF
jgi:hypothetical protein